MKELMVSYGSQSDWRTSGPVDLVTSGLNQRTDVVKVGS